MEALNVEHYVVEVLDAHGHSRFRHRFKVGADPARITLGRSPRADVVLDDPHVAALHAAIEVNADGEVLISDLGSRNGIIIAEKRLRELAGHRLAGRDFEIGRTRVRVRTDRDALAPERADRDLDFARGLSRMLGAAAFLWLVAIVYSAWVEAPRDLPTTMATSLAVAIGVAAAWITFWSFLSRILQARWRWLTHASIFFCISTATFALDLLLDLGRFSFGMPRFEGGEALLLILGAAALLYLHLTHASALSKRHAMQVSVLLPALVVGTALWVQSRNHARDVNYIGVRTSIYPPVLRLRSGVSVEDYFTEAAKLKSSADGKRRAIPEAEIEDAVE